MTKTIEVVDKASVHDVFLDHESVEELLDSAKEMPTDSAILILFQKGEAWVEVRNTYLGVAEILGRLELAKNELIAREVD